MSYVDWFAKLLPTSLRRKIFGRYSAALGEALDAAPDGVIRDAAGAPMTTHYDPTTAAVVAGAPGPDFGVVERLKLSIKGRFPNVIGVDPTVGGGPVLLTPLDSLAQIAGERQLEQGSAESDAAFAVRVQNAWDAWIYGGTAYGVLLQLWILGYHNVKIYVVNGVVYTLQSATGDPAVDVVRRTLTSSPHTMSGSYWPSPGSSPARRWWTRFALIFDTPLPTPATGAPSDWTAGLPAADSPEMNTIRRIIARWKSGFAICDRIVVLTNKNLWGWPLTQDNVDIGSGGIQLRWGNASLKWGSATVTYYTP